jgi:hypothetical protein
VQIKTLALVAAAAFGLAGTNAVLACSTAAWNGGETGNPQEGRPADGVSRYSGQCGLKSAATAQFVTDNTPVAETTFRARFYVYTGLSAGTAQVFRANNTGGTQQIGVTYDFTANLLRFATTGGTGTLAVNPNAWYSVELDWSRARTNMIVTVRGAGATTDLTTTVTGVGAGDAVDVAQLGWVSGTGTATTRGIVTDAYESRRSTAIGRLCRGDANLDNTRNSGDQIAVRNEVFGTALAAGQPDANEDGVVNSGDQITVRNLVFAGQGACASGV